MFREKIEIYRPLQEPLQNWTPRWRIFWCFATVVIISSWEQLKWLVLAQGLSWNVSEVVSWDCSHLKTSRLMWLLAGLSCSLAAGWRPHFPATWPSPQDMAAGVRDSWGREKASQDGSCSLWWPNTEKDMRPLLGSKGPLYTSSMSTTEIQYTQECR